MANFQATLLQNSDVFGGESDSESDSPTTSVTHDVANPSSNLEAEQSKKKRRKRQSTPKEKKPRRLKKVEIQQIHSDSQRMVRESSLNLPQYQPRTKDLNSFLNRVRSRNPQSAPVVGAIKSTLVLRENLALGHQTNKENSPSPATEDSFSPNDSNTAPLPTTEQHSCDLPLTTRIPSDHVKTTHLTPETTLNNKPPKNSTELEGITTETRATDADLPVSGDLSPIASHPQSPVDPHTKINTTKKPIYTKQTTITSLFSLVKQPKTESTELQSSVEPITDLLPATIPTVTPQLSSLDEFLLERDEKLSVEPKPESKLTPLERFQKRFTKHAMSSQSSKLKVKVEADVEDKTPLVSEELIAKLVDKPGAIRQHLRSKLQEQLSQRRAEERQAAEEVRRLYSEDIVPEEEEREMTDAETTDEEYEQGSELVAGESDPCSDLDEDEKLSATIGENSPIMSNQNSDENQDLDSDDDDIKLTSLTRKKSAAIKILDSDDEDFPLKHITNNVATTSVNSVNTEDYTQSSSNNNNHSNSSIPKLEDKPFIPILSTECSMSMFDNATTTNIESYKDTVEKDSSFRRLSSLTSQEASMPPLMLNLSSGSEDTDNEDEAYLPKDPNENQTEKDEESGSVLTFKLPENSGMVTATDGEDSQQTVATDEIPCGSVCESLEASALGDRDSSLEMSFRWPDGPSLPPAQLRREDSTRSKSLGFSGEIFDPQSQWEEAQALPPVSMATNALGSQDVSMNEATQFLDADGFLCVHKEKRQAHPSSALKDSLDPTQYSSPSELLDLCSGKFEDTQERTNSRRRHPSDPNGTQDVRELLGLPIKSKPVGISGLLSREGADDCIGGSSGGFGDTQVFSLLSNEVIGLCSGVFPMTQIARPSQSGGGADSDDESQRGDGGVLKNVAAGYYADSESEDEDMPLIKKRLKHKANQHQKQSNRLAEFVESEAELSGSDVGPDDDEEILAEEEEGMYDDDLGDQSDVPLSESELRNQVNKAHMKHTLADDKADLKHIQERFLIEGDLYEDGLAMKNGFFRSRRFAKQGSEVGSVDLFSEGLGEELEGVTVEGEEFNSQAEAKRRKDRLEREEFIKCQERDSGVLEMDEDSQSILSMIMDNSSQSMINTPLLPSKSNHLSNLSTPTLSSGGYKHSRGSFLKHDSNTLRRLSSLTAATPKAGGMTNRFVFHKKPGAVADKQGDKSKPQAKKNAKRLISTEKVTEPKRLKLDRSLSTPLGTSKHPSIFSMLK